jgi:hypothetical protein
MPGAKDKLKNAPSGEPPEAAESNDPPSARGAAVVAEMLRVTVVAPRAADVPPAVTAPVEPTTTVALLAVAASTGAKAAEPVPPDT